MTGWSSAVFGLISFVLGVVVGLTLREAFTIAVTGHTSLMRIPHPRPRTIGLSLLFAALAVNASLGFMLVSVRAAQVEADRLDDARLACTIRYNETAGDARDERVAQYVDQLDAELDLWAEIRRGVKTDTLTGEALVASVNVYLDRLRETRTARLANPYPSPDLCRSVKP